MSDDDLVPLVARAKAGDGAAFGALVRATEKDVWRLCAYLVDRASADDLSQETYLRAVRALASYSGTAPLRTWLLTIARRTCADELRGRQRRRRLLARLDPATSQPDRSGEVELGIVLRQLEAGRREAFVLTQVLGLSYDDAAEIVGCPIGTIRSRVARARADLVAALESDRDDRDACLSLTAEPRRWPAP